AAKMMFEITGCAGVSIGRGAFYNPWIFQHTAAYLATGQILPEPGFPDRVAVMTRHLELMIEVFGETHGCRMFRKVAPWYAKRFGPASEFNRRIVQLASKAEYEQILATYIQWRRQFLDDNGELLPKYQNAPMVASFIPAAAVRSAIPVP